MSLEVILLAMITPIIFIFGMVASHRPSTSKERYLSAAAAVQLAVGILMVAVACAWLGDQGPPPWYLPIDYRAVGPVMFLLKIAGLMAIIFLGIQAGGAVGNAIKTRQGLSRGHVIVALAYAAILPAIFSVSQTGRWLSRGTDEAMLTNFQRHEAEFQRLADMAMEDHHYMRVAPDIFREPARPKSAYGEILDPLANDRWEAYRTLLRATDVRGGFSVSNDGRQVEFLYWKAPLIADWLDRGYIYTTEPLGSVKEVTDDGWIYLWNNDTIYRQIGDHWYMFSIVW